MNLGSLGLGSKRDDKVVNVKAVYSDRAPSSASSIHITPIDVEYPGKQRRLSFDESARIRDLALTQEMQDAWWKENGFTEEQGFQVSQLRKRIADAGLLTDWWDNRPCMQRFLHVRALQAMIL